MSARRVVRPPPVVQQPNPLSPPRAQQEYSQNRPDSLYTSPSPYRYGAQDDGYGYSGRDGFDGSAAGSGYQNEAAVDFGDFDEAVKEQMIRMEEQLRRSLRESRESSRGERRYAEEQPYRADSLPEYHHPPRDTYRHEDYAQQHHGQEYQPQQRPPAQTSHGSEHVSPKRTSQPLDATLPWQKPPPDKRAIQARYRAELEQQMQMDKQLRAMAANSGQSVVPSPQQPSAPRQFSASHRQDRRPSYDEPGYYADNLDNDFRLQPPPRTRPSAPEATPPSYSWPQQPPREHVYHDEYERDRYLPEGDRSVEHNGVMPIPSEAGRRAELRQRQKAQADALAAQLAEKKLLEDQQRGDASYQRRGSRRNSEQYERFDQRMQPHAQSHAHPRAQPPLGESFLDGFGKQDIKAIAARERAERAYQSALPQPHHQPWSKSPGEQRHASHSPIQMNSPRRGDDPNDEDMVQGPFGLRRRGGGGEPTANNDLRARHGQLQSPASSVPARSPQQCAPQQQRTQSPIDSTRHHSYQSDPHMGMSPGPARTGSGPMQDPAIAQRRQAAEMQRRALEEQMAEKRRLQELAAQKEKEEEERATRKWEEEQRQLALEKEREQQRKAQENAERLEKMRQLQAKEAEARQRLHRREREQQEPAVQPSTPPRRSPMRRTPPASPPREPVASPARSTRSQDYHRAAEEGPVEAPVRRSHELPSEHSTLDPVYEHTWRSADAGAYRVRGYESVFDDDRGHRPGPPLEAPPRSNYRPAHHFAPYATDDLRYPPPPFDGSQRYREHEEHLPYPPDRRYHAHAYDSPYATRGYDRPHPGHAMHSPAIPGPQHSYYPHGHDTFRWESRFVEEGAFPPHDPYAPFGYPHHPDMMAEPSLASDSLLIALNAPVATEAAAAAAPTQQHAPESRQPATAVPPASPLGALVENMPEVRSQSRMGSSDGQPDAPPAGIGKHDYLFESSQPVSEQQLRPPTPIRSTDFPAATDAELIVVPTSGEAGDERRAMMAASSADRRRPATTQHFEVRHPSADEQRALLGSRGGTVGQSEHRARSAQERTSHLATWDTQHRPEPLDFDFLRHETSAIEEYSD